MHHIISKKITQIAIAITGVLSLTIMSFIPNTNNMEESKSIYELSINSIEGENIDLANFKGKKMLFVNVASKCGYTPQYAGLQELQDTYGKDVVIIGVPCNQFMHQEPGTNEEIISFCEKNYGVTFQITEKVDVKGKNQHPLYKWLTSKSENGVMDSNVKWNFQKYLVDENGKLVEMFSPNVKPLDEKITSLLQ